MRRGLDIGASPCFRLRGIEPLGRPRMTGFTKPGSDKAIVSYFDAIAVPRVPRVAPCALGSTDDLSASVLGFSATSHVSSSTNETSHQSRLGNHCGGDGSCGRIRGHHRRIHQPGLFRCGRVFASLGAIVATCMDNPLLCCWYHGTDLGSESQARTARLSVET